MTLAALMTRRATITHATAGATDHNAYGRTVADVEVITDVPCAVQPTGGVEVLIGRDTVVADFRGYFPAGTAIGSGDTFTVDGDDFAGMVLEVMGPVQPSDAGQRGAHHVEVLARAVTA